METEEKLEKLGKLLDGLAGKWIFVEGKRDKSALEGIGLRNILTISGNLRLSCERLADLGKVEMVFVLTDLDRRGDQLAKLARGELEGRSIRADLEMRKDLAYVLNIRNFEDAKRAYDKLGEDNRKFKRGHGPQKGEKNG